MSDRNTLIASLDRLLDLMEREEYKGYDPYDGLTSPLFRLPLLSRNRRLRFFAQQAVKRSPFNLRPLLGIRKSVNPVTLGLAIQAYALLEAIRPCGRRGNAIQGAMDCLEEMIPLGYDGACWGYDFPWEARYGTIPAYQPTGVATGIISNALYRYHALSGDPRARDLVLAACTFAARHLNHMEAPDGALCFSYSPFDREKVVNASLKVSRLFAQGYALSGDPELKDLAARSVRWAVRQQRHDGAWAYSLRATGQRVDNYHTGYVLDCLHDYVRCTDDRTPVPALDRGLAYYIRNFIDYRGMPRFYHDRAWPVDCTAGGQAILTLCRFGLSEMADRVALWMIENMQDQKGFFYYRRYNKLIVKTPHMRWSNAWMAAGLSELVYRHHS